MSKINTDFFVDFHCHPSLRGLNTGYDKSKEGLWLKTQNPHFDSAISRWVRMKTPDLSKESQSNLYAYAKNKTRVIVDAMYPVEKGWYNFRKFPSYIVGKKSIEEILRVATGISEKRLRALIGKTDYFEELQEIYDYLIDNQGSCIDGEYAYKIVRNYQELKSTLEKDDHTLAVIISIEGGHALGAGSPNDLNQPFDIHKKKLIQNIGTIKDWQFPPFFINLSHHYWNQLSGHARSLKTPINLVFNQNKGIDLGITKLGWVVIEELLSNGNGKRVLIDTKHMSVMARKEYYRFIARNNRINSNNKIPIICGHAGVNGYKTINNSVRDADNGTKLKRGYFNNWSINLSREEINIIHQSGGIIGIMLDKGLLGSPATNLKIESSVDSSSISRQYCKLICDNLFEIIKSINHHSAWDVPVLASDFDGLINHIPGYNNAGKLPDLESDLITFLKSSKYQEQYWYGMSPETLVNRFMKENALNFLEKNFI